MKKHVTRYIPAGMNLRFDNSNRVPEIYDNEIPTNKTNKKKSNQADQYAPDTTTNVNGKNTDRKEVNFSTKNAPKKTNHKDMCNSVNEKVKHEVRAPPIICRSKSFVLDRHVKHSVSDHNIKNVDNPCSSKAIHSETDDWDWDTEISSSVTSDEQCEYSSIKEVGADKKAPLVTALATSDEKRVDAEVACNKKTPPLSFKNKILNQIKKYEKRKLATKEAQKCNCSNCDRFLNCEVWCNHNINFSNSTPLKKSLPLLKTSFSDEINVSKVYRNDVLVYGPIVPKPIDSLAQTHFHESVQKALNTMNCSSVKNIQTFIWPASQRGLNVCMIGPSQCGKTLAYLPAFCTFAFDKSGKYVELSVYEGPLIIILCPNKIKCEELGFLLNNLIEDEWDGVEIDVITHIATPKKCDILVTTPAILEKCLKAESVKLKRVCHVALEESDALLKNEKSIGNIFKTLNAIQINRPHHKTIQVIVSSSKWTVDLQQLISKLYTTPVVIFEDFLEAALCSNVKFIKKELNSAYKKFYLEDILKKQYSTHRSIVFCEDNEIAGVCEYLALKGIECISISNDIIEDEIYENEDMWSSLKPGRYQVLLCTDPLFKKTQRVVNAKWLIHYSIPSDWKTFQMRFRCLVSNLNSLWDSSQDDICSFLVTSPQESSNDIIKDFLELLVRKFQLK